MALGFRPRETPHREPSPISTMVEEQAQHRRRLEESVTNANTKLETRGQFFGFLIAMTALMGGGYLIASGQSVWGISLPIATIAGLAGVFVWKSRERKRELKEQMGVVIPAPAPPPEPPQKPEQ